MELQQLRAQIDQIDDQLIVLFKERMEVAAKIGEYKKANGLPVLMPQREQEKLQDVALKAGEDMAQYAKKLYAVLFELSRDYQSSQKGVME